MQPVCPGFALRMHSFLNTGAPELNASLFPENRVFPFSSYGRRAAPAGGARLRAGRAASEGARALSRDRGSAHSQLRSAAGARGGAPLCWPGRS